MGNRANPHVAYNSGDENPASKSTDKLTKWTWKFSFFSHFFLDKIVCCVVCVSESNKWNKNGALLMQLQSWERRYFFREKIWPTSRIWRVDNAICLSSHAYPIFTCVSVNTAIKNFWEKKRFFLRDGENGWRRDTIPGLTCCIQKCPVILFFMTGCLWKSCFFLDVSCFVDCSRRMFV